MLKQLVGKMRRTTVRVIPGWHILLATQEMKPATNTIFAALHNPDMEPTVSRVRTQSELWSLLQVLKEHSNDGIDNLVQASNAYCYRRAMSEYDEAESSNALHSLPSKPCRIVVVNEQEMLTRMMKAFERLQSDGLKTDFVSLPNPSALQLPTDASEITKTIRDIDRVTDSYIRVLPDEFLLKSPVMTTDFKRNSSGRTRIYEYTPPQLTL